MKMFVTRYNARERDLPFANPGERFVKTYQPNMGSDGVLDLIEAEPFDLYESIQSHADSVDINLIISRFINGDVSVLNKRTPMYFDATEMPRTYAEMYQKVIDAHNYFEQLPLDVREKFGHSPETFFALIGTDEWNDKMKDFLNLDDVLRETIVEPAGGDIIEQKPE